MDRSVSASGRWSIHLYEGYVRWFLLQIWLTTSNTLDQGKNFDSKLFHELCKIAEVNKTRTSLFQPRSDGQTERANRTILQMLCATAQTILPIGPIDYLPSLQRTAWRSTDTVTHTTPNMAMLGREVLFPTTLIASLPEELVHLTVPFVESFRQTMSDAHEQVRTATKSVARTQKTYFDKYVKGPPFHVGQIVWLYWPLRKLRQRHRKLIRLWTSPRKILEFKTAIVVVIQNTVSHKKQTVHVDRLVPCNSSTPIPPPPSLNSSSTHTSPDMEHGTTSDVTDACHNKFNNSHLPHQQLSTTHPCQDYTSAA